MNIREETIELHKAAEETLFAKKMIEGKLTKDEYVRYLNAQWLIFNEMEKRHILQDEFSFIRKNESIRRLNAIEDDLASLGERVDGAYMPSSSFTYANFLNSLTDEVEQNSHIYLNYMGMMFGGGIVAKNNYSEGNLYKFDNRTEVIASIRALEVSPIYVNQGFKFHIDIFNDLWRI
jgi:heme oxygenase